MSPGSELTYQQLNLSVDGVGLTVATAGRGGGLAPIIFLHGFGSTKEDYAHIALQPAFAGRPFLTYDAPGCGETCCEDLSQVSIPFLVNTAQTVLRQAGIGRFHLVGHSMGGLCVSSSDLAPLVVMNLGSTVPAELKAWGDNRRHGPAVDLDVWRRS